MLTNYIKKDSLIHKLNPAVKIFLALIIIFLSFLIRETYKLSLFSALSFILAFAAKIPKEFFKTLGFIMTPLLITLVIFHGILNPAATQVIATFYFLSIKLDGLIIGFNYFAKLLSFVSISYILIFTTNPADLVASLSKLGLPKQAAFVTLATIQFIPLMEEKAKKIMDAQQARGLRIIGGIIQRIKAYIPLLMPLILSMLDEAYERSISLELRAFFSKNKRTFFREELWRKTDTITSIILAVIVGGIIIV
ncbi:Energy-coupling factor transporter transmembrane protein EcfT [Candidatus Tiddalikarchaeum anstoanum]|nr:Energy-coupling factor transporter transmembrane protein EcfT [Candidatus Tiddalikarchaeum anstoanum]